MTDPRIDDVVRVEVTVPAPIDTVWEAFRDRDMIRRWHGWDDPSLEEEIQMIYFDETVASEEERTIHVGIHLFAFEDAGAQTVVRVMRAAPVSTTSGTDWTQYYDDIEAGWLSFLHQLRFVLMRHPTDARRTIFRGFEQLEVDGSQLPDLLGLGAVADIAPGGRYAAMAATGDQVSGEVWFRDELQFGLTVDAWGDGLLIMTRSPDATGGHGSASMILSTYGLEPAAFDALEARWADWWNQHVKG